MSFFEKLKKSFGFGVDDEFDNIISEYQNNDSTPSAISNTDHESESAPTYSADRPELVEPAPLTIDPEMKTRIFDGVVRIFNDSLPDFLAKSVDPERQRKLLADSLDESVNRYLDDLLSQARAYAEARLQYTSQTMMRDAEQMRAEIQTLEQQRSSIQEQQLSADRRRRALGDRVKKLEEQLERSEAECEQFQLENKSLLNKIKVAEVQPGIVDDIIKERDEALTERDKMKIERDEALAECNRAKAAAADSDRQLSNNSAISQTMYDDMQTRMFNERQEKEQLKKELDEAKVKIEEAREALTFIEQFQEQMNQIEEVVQKRDERIAKLKSGNKRLRDRVAELEKELSEAHNPSSEGGLFDLEEKSSPESSEIVQKLNEIEDDFECPDWFVAEPAPIVDRSDSSDFGYTEPPRKKRADNDAQLSLF